MRKIHVRKSFLHRSFSRLCFRLRFVFASCFFFFSTPTSDNPRGLVLHEKVRNRLNLWRARYAYSLSGRRSHTTAVREQRARSIRDKKHGKKGIQCATIDVSCVVVSLCIHAAPAPYRRQLQAEWQIGRLVVRASCFSLTPPFSLAARRSARINT